MDQRPAKLGDPLVLEEVTAQDETVHLAVKGNQFETQLMQLMERLKTLTDQRLKEAEGFNMLFSELAEAIKQREVQDLFKEKGKTGAGNAEPRIHISEEGDGKEMKTKKETTMNDLSYDLENLILIVATLLTTVTYEAVLSPPPYIWKEGTKFDYGCLFRKSKHMFSIHRSMQECPARNFYYFIILNTAGFMSSVLMIFLRCPAQLRDLVYLITIMLLGNYIILLSNLTPDALSFLVALLGVIICALLLLIINIWRRFNKKLKETIRCCKEPAKSDENSARKKVEVRLEGKALTLKSITVYKRVTE